MFRNLFEGSHLIVLALVFIVLFGYKKLPDAARSIGRSMRIFKAETKGLRDDSSDAPTTSTSAPTVADVPVPDATPPVAGAGSQPGV